jgi:hypothetical protein
MLLGWYSTSTASLMMCSVHLVFMGRILGNCIQWHRAMLYSATADFSGSYTLVCHWCFLILVSMDCPVWPM